MGLKRSTTDKKLAGVCAGIADSLGMDPTIIRVLFVLAAVFGFGSPVIIYLILAVIMPER
jgi:phage shock protein PspC (stress-responsive transcriptional regulator)